MRRDDAMRTERKHRYREKRDHGQSYNPGCRYMTQHMLFRSYHLTLNWCAVIGTMVRASHDAIVLRGVRLLEFCANQQIILIGSTRQFGGQALHSTPLITQG